MVCTDFRMLEVKVPISFSGRQGFPARRDRRYVICRISGATEVNLELLSPEFFLAALGLQSLAQILCWLTYNFILSWSFQKSTCCPFGRNWREIYCCVDCHSANHSFCFSPFNLTSMLVKPLIYHTDPLLLALWLQTSHVVRLVGALQQT